MKRSFALLSITFILAALLSSAQSAQVQAQTQAPTAAPTAASDPLGGATTFAKADQPTQVTLMLDYTPNTNHLGLYAAQALGYYKDANLTVGIQQPGDVAVEQIVGTGKAQFGVSYQDQATFSLQSGQPIVSIAAIVQHDTSAFASLHDKHPIKTPADLAGLRYGAFGSPIEQPTLDLMTKCVNASAANVQFINVGNAEPFPLMEQDRIDFVWLFYAWDGIRAKQQGLNVDFLFLKDYTQCVPDYYTPLLITSADMIKNHPDVVRAFTQATARGYTYSIQHPDEAAALLSKAVPDLDAALVKESAEWLESQFQADALRWGEQKLSIWQGYSDWLVKNGVLDHPIDANAAFTNAFLPGSS
jgi:ABC-type nitrate/sulfonate/bicarbonate transport system substrate-binding protein